MNVPETMNEVLDMSDDEGMKTTFAFIMKCDFVFVSWRTFIGKMFLEMFMCFHVYIKSIHYSHIYIVHLNHAVRKASAPEMLSDGEYISDVEEGICDFLLW